MRKVQWSVWLVFVFIAGTAAFTTAQGGAEEAPKPEQLTGKWSGTWDGAGSGGGFELTLEQIKDGPLTGKVAVTGEPEYTAALKTLAFDGRKMKASYDFPADEAAAVLLAAAIEGDKATGTWTLRAKAGEAQVASGSWTVTRVGAVREPPK
jgi:hypothetical protein